MQLNKTEATLAAKHFLFALARGFILFGSHKFLTSLNDNVMYHSCVYTLDAAQVPGIYNNFRKFLQHSTNSIEDSSIATYINSATKHMPEIPSPVSAVNFLRHRYL